MHSRALRIGIIGSGAIGGFYGLMLAKAGFDVHFLLRSEYPAVCEHGLSLDSAEHGTLQLKVQAYARAADMPPCDWLLIGAKATSNDHLAPLIVQAAAPGAKVVLLQNGLGSRSSCARHCAATCTCWAGCASSVSTGRGQG